MFPWRDQPRGKKGKLNDREDGKARRLKEGNRKSFWLLEGQRDLGFLSCSGASLWCGSRLGGLFMILVSQRKHILTVNVDLCGWIQAAYQSSSFMQDHSLSDARLPEEVDIT
jgi:hypothetical protein